MMKNETAGLAGQQERDRLVRLEVNVSWIRWLLVAAILGDIAAATWLDGRLDGLDRRMDRLEAAIAELTAIVRGQ